jgi:protein-disulfide isomerase
VVGAAFVVGAFVLKSGLDRQSEQLGKVVAAVAKLEDAFRNGEGPRLPARVADAPQVPDPSKRYDVAVGDAPVRGPADAKVTIVEFSDFQCPFCNRVEPTLAKIRATYPKDVRVVFKNLPLRIHPDAPAAHAAAEAARRQGKFWEMHDKIFGNQRDLSPATLRGYAQQLGLDMARYDRDVASQSVKDRIAADAKQADKLGVSGTPAFFINGKYFSGAQPFESFQKVIDQALAAG